MKTHIRQHKRRLCENPKCGKIYKPQYADQEGCSYKCYKAIKKAVRNE